MIRSAAGKVMWVGRATVFLVGLSVILALLFGVASTALGANDKPFLLGEKNVASAISTLVKKGAGPALKLQVGAGQPPMAVNSTERVANLNAASAGRADSAASADTATSAQNAAHANNADHAATADSAPVSGYEIVSQSSAFDSSAHKSVNVFCPQGKEALGGGSNVFPSLSDPNRDRAPIAIRANGPSDLGWDSIADETSDYSANWSLTVFAICANTSN